MKIDEKTEEGVMILDVNNNAWGTSYADGHSTSYGFIRAAHGKLSDGQFVRRPSDLTYRGSPDTDKLNSGRIVKVRRTTIVEIIK